MRPRRKTPIHILVCFLFFQCANVYADDSGVSAVKKRQRTEKENQFDPKQKSKHSLSGHLVISGGILRSSRTQDFSFRKDTAWGFSGSAEYFFSDHFSLGLGMRKVSYLIFELNQNTANNKVTIAALYTRISPIGGSWISPYIRLGAGVASGLRTSYVIALPNDQSIVFTFPERNWSRLATQMEAGLSLHLQGGLWMRGGLSYTNLTTFSETIYSTPPLPFGISIGAGDDDIDTFDWSLEMALVF